MKSQTLLPIIAWCIIISCTQTKKTDIVFEEFKSGMEKEGLRVDSVDESGLVYISKGEWTFKVSLDNARKDYERDKDKTQITKLVEAVASHTIELPNKWEKVKDSIFISFFPNDYEFTDSLHEKITDDFSKVYVYNGAEKLIWITNDDLTKWGVSESDLDKQANQNADKLLATSTITFETIETRKLGIIDTEEKHLTGALLFAPSMKDKLKKDFGFPFYAVIPVRDFCYIFSRSDFDFFSTRIGQIVVDEYKKSGHPITTEILKFSEKGVEGVGKYPAE